MGALPLLNCQRAFRLGRERTAPAASTCFMLATTVMRAKQRVRTAAHVLVAFALASSAPLRGMSYARRLGILCIQREVTAMLDGTRKRKHSSPSQSKAQSFDKALGVVASLLQLSQQRT